MSNFGIGLGSFLTGVSNGAQAYENIQNLKEQRADREEARADRANLRQIGQQGTADANAARQADIGKSIIKGQDVSSGVAKPTWTVNGKTFDNEADAHAHAESNVGSFMDYYTKTVMPKYQEHWLQTGEVEKAQVADKWMQDADVQRGMKSWAGAVRAFQTGDREGFKTNLMAAYNNQKYFDDGTTAKSIDDVKDAKGNLTGYKITFVDGKGNERDETFDGNDIGRLALNALSPAQVISYGFDQLKSAQSTSAELAKEQRQHGYKMQENAVTAQVADTRAARTQTNAQDNIRLRAQLERENKIAAAGDPKQNKKVLEAQAIGQYLKSQGYSDEYIAQQAPRLAGVQAQTMSPENRMNNIMKVMASSDPTFGDLPDAEKVARATSLMKAQDEGLAQQASGNRAQPQGRGITLPPAAADAQVPVQSQGKGVKVYDTKTNSNFYR